MMKSKTDQLKDLVELYRYLEKPDVSDDKEYIQVQKVECTEALVLLINKANESLDCITNVTANGKTVVKLPLPNDNNIDEISFTIKLPRMPARVFFVDIADFLSFKPLQKGIIPDAFYIAGSDFLYKIDKDIQEITKLKEICGFIKLLKELLTHTEDNDGSSWYRFVVISNKDDGRRYDKKIFKSKFNFSDFEADLDGISRFSELNKTGDLHSYERVIVFRNAISELLSNEPNEDEGFSYVLSHFQRLVEIYNNNYETYINNFSLEKFKKDVVESYTKYASELDSVVNDATTKSLAIPASLTAVALLARLDSDAGKFVMLLVVLFTTIISYSQMTWYLTSLEQVENSMNNIFSKFQGKTESGATFVEEKRDVLVTRIAGATFRIYWFITLSWLIIPVAMFLV